MLLFLTQLLSISSLQKIICSVDLSSNFNEQAFEKGMLNFYLSTTGQLLQLDQQAHLKAFCHHKKLFQLESKDTPVVHDGEIVNGNGNGNSHPTRAADNISRAGGVLRQRLIYEMLRDVLVFLISFCFFSPFLL